MISGVMPITFQVFWEKRVFKFILVGLWNSFIGLGSFIFLEYFFSGVFQLSIILTLATIISNCQAFFTQRTFVWKSSSPIPLQIVKYFLVSAINFLLNLVLLNLLVIVMRFPADLCQGLIMLVFSFVNYFVLRNWTFKQRDL